MKALIEVEFTGPDADKGAKVMVNKSNEMSGSIGIPMPTLNCRALNYRLVEEVPAQLSENAIGTAFLFGCGVTGVISSAIAFFN
jgi:hypothetical protein